MKSPADKWDAPFDLLRTKWAEIPGYSGSTPSAVRYKNWKLYYTMSVEKAAGWLEPLKTYHFPLIQNIKRDPFEQFVVPTDTKSLLMFGGSLAARAQPICTTDLA